MGPITRAIKEVKKTKKIKEDIREQKEEIFKGKH
jgi:hypothetical protein